MAESTKSIKSSVKSISHPKLSLTVLGDEDVRKIHEATLEIIETIGVRFPLDQALDIWEEHGARVDRSRAVARVPRGVIESALRPAPPVYTLPGVDSALDLPLDGNHVYLGTDGCGVEVIDIHSGKRRRSCLQDVADITRVVDGLEEIAFCWVPVSAQDCPPRARGLHELLATWKNTTKHVQTESIYTEHEARGAVEMAAILAGGRDALRERPVLSLMSCTVSPLAHDPGSLAASLVAAAAGLPVGFMSMCSCAMTGPATIAGNLAVANAEVLSALALIELAHPGAPVFYAAAQTVMDLRSGAYTGGGPEDFLFGAASNVLADFYNVPLSMGTFATGAKEPNWQAGVENSLSTFMASVVMSDMLLGAGLLHGSTIWSYEQLIMDCEIFGIVAKMMQGIVVDDEQLALGAIRDVGPGGHYLTHKHTLRHMRELWINRLLDRRPYSEWERKPEGTRAWALARAQEALETHCPPTLDPKVEAELQRIIRAIENE